VQQAVILPVVQQSIGSHIMPPPNVQMSGLMAQQEWCSQAVLDGAYLDLTWLGLAWLGLA
jgi:hypothetical protein